MILGLIILLVERLAKTILKKEDKRKASWHQQEKSRVCLDHLRLYKDVLSENTMKIVIKELHAKLKANSSLDDQFQ